MLARECSNGFSLDTLLALHITSTSSGLPEMACPLVVEAWLTSLVKREADAAEVADGLPTIAAIDVIISLTAI
jgi:hypothetical protein